MVSESSQEDGSVLEVNCELGSQQKSTRTLVLVGRSGNGKSATGNSILGRQAFKSKSCASGVTSVCGLQSSTLLNGQILNVIDTPGLFSLSPSTEVAFKEILRCLSLTKEGIDAVVLVFFLRNRLTEEEKSALFALKSIFGSKLVDYMIVVFTNEDALEDYGVTFEEYLDDSSDFKEILKACHDRNVLFENKAKTSDSRKAKQVQELLNYVEEIARKNGKLYMDDLSHDLEVKTQLRETTERLEQQLNKEQAARLELEKRAKEAEKHLSDIVQKLREDLARAENNVKYLQNIKWCIIL